MHTYTTHVGIAPVTPAATLVSGTARIADMMLKIHAHIHNTRGDGTNDARCNIGVGNESVAPAAP
eukprot:869852-Karenia_brevis.AAC.1